MSTGRPAVEAPSKGGGFGGRLLLLRMVGGLLLVAGVAVGAWAAVGLVDGDPVQTGEGPVTAMELRRQVAHTSPVMARDPSRAEFVAAATRQDAARPGCELQVSGSGGERWVAVEAVDPLPEPVAVCDAATVGFDERGRLVYSFVGLDESRQPAGLWRVVSGDRAQTFTQPRRVVDAEVVSAGVAVDGERVESVWLEAASDRWAGTGSGRGWPVGSRVVAASGGPRELGTAQVVAEPQGLVAAPTVVGAADDGTVVAYYELPREATVDDGVASLVGRGPWRLMVARRPGAGEAFGAPVAVAEFELPEQPGLLSGERPSASPHPHLVSRLGIAEPGLAAGDDRGCVAWTDYAHGGLRAQAACSPDGEAEWGEPVRLAAGWEGESTEWLPQLAIGSSGQVEAAFYARDGDSDLATPEWQGDVWYAAAPQPADGFDRPLRITSQSSHPDTAPHRDWYGTRLGLEPGPPTTVAMWADSRNSVPVYPNQTLFAATIAAADDQAGAWGWVAVGLLVAGGVGILASVAARRRPSPGEPTSAGRPAAAESVGGP